MCETIRFPQSFISGEYAAVSLVLDNGAVIYQCIKTTDDKCLLFYNSIFYIFFRSIYHTSPARWIREKRLRKVREMLTATTMPDDVCYSLVFENPTHFSCVFKQKFGVTPSQVNLFVF